MQTGEFRTSEGYGKVLLIQRVGETHINVAHFYGHDAVRDAVSMINLGDLKWLPNLVRMDGEPDMTPIEFVDRWREEELN